MTEIINLFDKTAAAKGEPQATNDVLLEGPAICGACKHEWRAERPVGFTHHLPCPQCKRRWGAFKHAVQPETVWSCECGEDLFWLTPKGAVCRRCGLHTDEWAG